MSGSWLIDYWPIISALDFQLNEFAFIRIACPWSSSLTRENIDLNRVPQVIHEATCHTSHSCRGLDNAFGLETIPVSLRMPVLKKNPSCFPQGSYSLEFELITIACLCAISRRSWCDCSDVNSGPRRAWRMCLFWGNLDGNDGCSFHSLFFIKHWKCHHLIHAC